MATIYIDPTVSGTGTGTLEDPYQSWASVSWVAGNNYLQKGGTTYNGRLTVGASGTLSSRIFVGSYGNISKAKILGGVTDTAAARVAQRSYVTFMGLDFSCPVTSSSGNGLEGFFTSSTEGLGIWIINCDFHDCKNIGLALFTTVVGVGATVRNSIIMNCNFINNGYHGSAIYGSVFNVQSVNNYYFNNALTVDGHGASNFAHRTTYTNTGWSNPGGTVYSRALTAPGGTTGTPNNAYQVVYNKSPYWNLTKNNSTPTTPGLGEFGYDSGNLYINVGEAPAVGREVKVSVEEAKQIYYINCKALDTFKVSAEGSGFQADDFAEVTYQGCISQNNAGSGFFFNLGRFSKAIGCVALNNLNAGFHTSAAPSINLDNNLSANNVAEGISIDLGSDSSTVRNSIIMGNSIGIYVDTDSTSVTANFNNYFNNTTNYSGISSGGSDQTVNPQLLSSFLPQNVSLQTAGTNLGGSDFYGYGFTLTPTIGAVQYHVDRTQSFSPTQNFTKTQSFSQTQRII